jgi:CRISPR-associated protein Csd1
MILYALDQLYGRLQDDPAYGVAPLGYSTQKISFKVVLRPDGSLVSIEDTRDFTEGGRPVPRQELVLGSPKPSGPGINPCFLWDNSGYMLGFKPDDPKPERTRETFEAFRRLHLDREEDVDVREFSAVCRFLEGWRPDRAFDFEVLADAAATGFGLFQVVGQTRFVHQHPAIGRWWQGRLADEDRGPEGQCLISGRSGPLARTHEKVRGVAGAQSSGAALVGFNDPAYESYGKRQSFNAPVSQEAAFRYVTALNALLSGSQRKKHRLLLADSTLTFWTDRPSPLEDIFLQFLEHGSEAPERAESQDEAQRQRLHALLDAVRQGRLTLGDLAPDPDGTRVFLLGLSPNAARISVRFFHQESVRDLIDKVHRHHRDIGLKPVPPRGRRRGDPEFPSIKQLLAQTAREPKDIPPMLEGPLLRAILMGTKYPHALFAAVIRRIRADRAINYLRCSTLKGYLTRNLNLEVSMALDHDRAEPAYRLGRLFAALEKTQKDALGGNLNKTIRDGFYSSASATPGSVFPRLLRTYQHHLAKLEGGFRVNRERLVQEIFAPMEGFPSHLSLSEQGLFAIGYYHQMQAFYMKSSDDADQ